MECEAGTRQGERFECTVTVVSHAYEELRPLGKGAEPDDVTDDPR